MTPDDWKTGMENEAASVEDLEWAWETTITPSRRVVRLVLVSSSVFGLMGMAQVLLLQFGWRSHLPDGLWTGVMIGVALLSTWLGTHGFSALEAGVGALAYVPGAWLAVVLLQGWLGVNALTWPGVPDEGAVVLGVLAMNAAGMVQVLRRRSSSASA